MSYFMAYLILAATNVKTALSNQSSLLIELTKNISGFIIFFVVVVYGIKPLLDTLKLAVIDSINQQNKKTPSDQVTKISDLLKDIKFDKLTADIKKVGTYVLIITIIVCCSSYCLKITSDLFPTTKQMISIIILKNGMDIAKSEDFYKAIEKATDKVIGLITNKEQYPLEEQNTKTSLENMSSTIDKSKEVIQNGKKVIDVVIDGSIDTLNKTKEVIEETKGGDN